MDSCRTKLVPTPTTILIHCKLSKNGTDVFHDDGLYHSIVGAL